MANYRNDFADVNLETGTICRNFMNHSIGSGDALGDRFGVRVFRNGEPVSLGGTVAGYFVRNTTGETVVISSGVVSGNEAYVTLPEACYAVEGSFTLAIKVTSGSETVTMRIVDGVVSRTNTSVTVDPGTLVPSIETLISAINSAVGQIPVNYNASFAPAYSASSTYAVGDYVVYDGYLWRCTTAITETESWTAAHWTKVALANDVSDLKSALTLDEEADTFYFKNIGSITVEYEQGGIGDNGTTLVTTDTRIRSKYFIPVTKYKTVVFKPASGYKYRIFWYGKDKAKLGSVNYRTTDLEQDLSSAYYFKIVIGKSDDSDIATSAGASAVNITGAVNSFLFRGYMNNLSYTKIADCKDPGWYGFGSSYKSSITDLPDNFPASGGYVEVITPVFANSAFRIAKLYDGSGNMWERIFQGSSAFTNWINEYGALKDAQYQTKDESFCFRGYLNSLEITSLANARLPGWYSCGSTYLASLTDLPSDFPTDRGLQLTNYNPTTGSGDMFVRQELSTGLSSHWVRVIYGNTGTVMYPWTKEAVGTRFAERPSSGYENFTFAVSTGIPDDSSGTTSLQDQATTANDRAILMLPSTYDPNGEPTRLLIIGCGTSGYITSSSTNIAANSVFDSQIALAEGYAVLQVNGTPGTDANNSHGDPFSIRSHVAAYKYVTEKYNIARDGVLAGGYSQGSLRTLQLAISQTIPIKALVTFGTSVDIWKDDYTVFGSSIRQSMMHNFGFEEKTANDIVSSLFPSMVGQTVEEPETFSDAGAVPTDNEKAYILNNIEKWAGYNPMTAKLSGVALGDFYKVWTAPSASEDSSETELYNGSINLPCPVKIYSSTGDTVTPIKWAKAYYNMLTKGGSLAELRTITGISHNDFVTNPMSVTVTAKDGQSYTTKSIVWEAMLFFRRWNV